MLLMTHKYSIKPWILRLEDHLSLKCIHFKEKREERIKPHFNSVIWIP